MKSRRALKDPARSLRLTRKGLDGVPSGVVAIGVVDMAAGRGLAKVDQRFIPEGAHLGSTHAPEEPR